jgi:2,3-bisphosphoglycerate-independent phosphoglycerate mutase
MPKQPLALFILDGWGISQNKRGNAVAQAQTPVLERLKTKYPYTSLRASGEVVGLPQGQMGNSEVGHLNIGAGRVVYQDLTRISRDVRQGSFFQNKAILETMTMVKASDKKLHIMGLLSDGGVHSHIEHLFALLEMAQSKGLTKVFIHCFLDGRDVPPDNALEYIIPLEQKCRVLETGTIATVMGRYYAMDRDQRWERVEKAYKAMFFGEGQKVTNAEEAVRNAYERKETDEFVLPTVIVNKNQRPVGQIQEGDGVIFYNFRPDRAREITRAFVDVDFKCFYRRTKPNVHFLCMTQYDKTIKAPIAYLPQSLTNTLGEVLAKNNLTQLRIAETEKYAHVTFFFDGGLETTYRGATRTLIPSPKVPTYDLQPEMSANELTDKLLAHLAEEKFDVIICNFANPDMVGHTGNMEATIKAMETVDHCLGRLVPEILQRNGTAIITADHGNAEHMKNDEGNPVTAHTTNEVPFILVSDRFIRAKLEPSQLEDIAPTMLQILGITQPEEMTGRTLIKF